MTPERLAQLKQTIQMALLDWRLDHDEDDGEPCDLLNARTGNSSRRWKRHMP